MNKVFNLYIYILSIILTGIFFYSCDVIEPPYTEKRQIDTTDTTKNIRKAILEEFTGFRCGNCPEAAELAQKLHETYGNKLILLRIHSGYYAKPTTQHSYDFRTPEGTEIDNFFGMSAAGNPNGLINRTGYPNKTHILRSAKWEQAINSVISQKPKMTIKLSPTYNSVSKEISVSAEVKFLDDCPANYRLVLHIVEDSVVQYQQDDRKNPPDIPDYVHNHVLRATVNSAWGEQLSDAVMTKGTTVIKNFKYIIPAGKDWRPEKLLIIAYVHDHGQSYEILQVEQEHVIK